MKIPNYKNAKYGKKIDAFIYVLKQESNNNLPDGFSSDGFVGLMHLNMIHPVKVKNDDRLYFATNQQWKDYILDLVINKKYDDEDLIIENTLDYFGILDKDMRDTMIVLTKWEFKQAKNPEELV